ncbi:MAG: signal recognition particle-docking protein FtsY [Bacillota bacterium]|nr:signal recognition particle-docking protein FtsY [Bacillota bacterium]
MGFFKSIIEKFQKNEDKDKYLSGLDRSKKSFGDRIRALSNSFRGINDELLEEIMIILLESDVGINTAQKIVDRFESNGADIKKFDSMEDYLINILYEFYQEEEDKEIQFNEEGPTVIFMVGVNGSGKTTTSAKLIQHYQNQGKKVAVAAADTFRAGAVDQIEEWANRLNAPCIKGKPNQDPSSVLVDACRYARENNVDILLCDTAGRLQNKTNLMKELTKMSRVVKKEIETAPHEVWLVLDATTGQNGISQAKLFLEATDVTGIVLTKMDGTAKGGVVLAIRDLLHIPVRFLGLGEKPEDLKPFDINAFLIGITKGLENDAK